MTDTIQDPIEKDEIEQFKEPLPRPSPAYRAAEAYYIVSMNRIKKCERGLIDIYSCEEFREVRDWLIKAVGQVLADEIMNKNI